MSVRTPQVQYLVDERHEQVHDLADRFFAKFLRLGRVLGVFDAFGAGFHRIDGDHLGFRRRPDFDI